MAQIISNDSGVMQYGIVLGLKRILEYLESIQIFGYLNTKFDI